MEKENEITKEEAKYLLEIARDIAVAVETLGERNYGIYAISAGVQKAYKALLADEDMTVNLKEWQTASKAKEIVKTLKEFKGSNEEKAKKLSVLFDDLGIDV